MHEDGISGLKRSADSNQFKYAVNGRGASGMPSVSMPLASGMRAHEPFRLARRADLEKA
jgi:hypothetical protein